MQLQDVLRAEKQNVEWGSWHQGPIPRRDFAISRRRKYRIPPETRWRILSFEALDEQFRVLVMFLEGKSLYRAALGRVVGRDMAILCSYDYDGTEPGWHCHVTCDEIEKVPPCVRRGPWVRRLPRGGGRHRRGLFNVSERSAATIAADVYRIRGTLL